MFIRTFETVGPRLSAFARSVIDVRSYYFSPNAEKIRDERLDFIECGMAFGAYTYGEHENRFRNILTAKIRNGVRKTFTLG